MTTPRPDIATQELPEALLLRRAYAHPVPEVQLIETHISWVFLAGDHVYKVKKPVNLGFLDFSTQERRRYFCEEEVRLNRRLAPSTYLGVVPVVRSDGGELRLGGPGTVVDHAVHMHRLPSDRMMDVLLARGEIDNLLLRRLASVVADFHARAATGPDVDRHGRPAAVAGIVLENLEELRQFSDTDGSGPGGPEVVRPGLFHVLLHQARGFLDTHQDLLEQRVREARIRDGHGDLHAGNICFTPAGLVIYDCIEFSPRFRCGDVACDLAFLTMDVDHRGFRGFADYVARYYAELSEDTDLALLLPFYKAYRALVRAKVLGLKAAAATGSAREEARLDAMSYAHVAGSYVLPPALFLTCGLPGTGKSHVARRLAEALGAVHVRSDVVRKRQAGLSSSRDASSPWGTGIYTAEKSDALYGEMLAIAEKHLRDRRTVIVDASFSQAARRDAFARLARDLGRDLVLLHVEVPEAVARERLTARLRDAEEPSDADLEVYNRARGTFQPPRELPAGQVVLVDGTRHPEENVAAAIECLVDL